MEKHLEFPEEEFKRRYDRIRETMTARGVDALLITREENVRYFTGYYSTLWDSGNRYFAALLPCDASLKPTLVVTGDSLFTPQSWIDEVRRPGDMPPYDLRASTSELLADIFKEKGLHTKIIGTELGSGMSLNMPQSEWGRLQQALPDAKFCDMGSFLWKQREIKSALEIEKIREACRIGMAAVRKGYSSLQVGMTEKEAAGIMLSKIFQEGATKISYFTLICGENRHIWANYNPRKHYTIKQGDLIVVDMGPTYEGYHADINRMASIGRPNTKSRKIMDAVIDANSAAIEAIKPGIKCGDLYEIAATIIRKAGFEQMIPSVMIGHGIGLMQHEGPEICEGSDVKLEPGMVITIEPWMVDLPEGKESLYNCEDNIVVTEAGREVLTESLPKDFWVV